MFIILNISLEYLVPTQTKSVSQMMTLIYCTDNQLYSRKAASVFSFSAITIRFFHRIFFVQIHIIKAFLFSAAK